MVDMIIQLVMSAVLLAGGVTIAVTLLRMHRDPQQPNLLDLITSTDRTGRARLDPRKCFEAGAFLTSTWGFVFLTASGKLTEFYFIGYMGAWVGARFLRDREQRLGSQQRQKQPATLG